MKRSLCEGRQLYCGRLSATGPLAKLVIELLKVFSTRPPRMNLADLTVGSKRTQSSHESRSTIDAREEFVRQSVDEDAVVLGERGPEAVLARWRRFWACLEDISIEFVSLDVRGTPENPVIVRKAVSQGRFTLNAFRVMFPGAVHRTDLQEKLVGRLLRCPVDGEFEFTPDNKIAVEILNFNYVHALLNAGCSLRDISDLMNGLVYTTSPSKMHQPVVSSRQLPTAHGSIGSVSTKLDLSFVLDDGDVEIQSAP